MDNTLRELIIDTAITTTLVTALWGLTCSILITLDPDEPCGITIFGMQPTRFVYCLSVSSVATAGVVWSLAKE
jgi:hypothetical protein